ncbi:MAG: DUF2160 domain-containing protein [Chloroflexales bacterium]|nr:DUF2160 domain-containing protein [Chloroflexales bacterium]
METEHEVRHIPEAADYEAAETPIVAPVQHAGRKGFLPISTNLFDRCFISVVCFVAIHLLWLRFVEAYLPLFIATILSLLLAVLIISRG